MLWLEYLLRVLQYDQNTDTVPTCGKVIYCTVIHLSFIGFAQSYSMFEYMISFYKHFRNKTTLPLYIFE